MRHYQIGKAGDRQSDDRGGSFHGEQGPVILAIPPAVIGFLLLLTVALACAFYLAAQLVQTP